MKVFTLDAADNVTAFASATAAKKSGSELQFKNAEGLAELTVEWPMSRLVAIWNQMAGVTPVKKFKDRATAVNRIWSAVQELEPGPTAADEPSEATEGNVREGSKRAQVLEMMRQPDGVTLEAIMAHTGWQKHTVRGFVSGSLTRKGVAVESFKRPDGARAYRVTD